MAIKITALLFALLMTLASCIELRDADSPLTFPDYARDTDENESEPDDAVNASHEYDTADASAEPPESDESVPDTEEPESLDSFADVSIDFIAAGDNLIHPNIYIDARARGVDGKEYDFLPMYSDAADFISSADLAFINQETVMAGADYGYSGYPCFNAPQQLGIDLAQLGFNVINIANNHMLDKGASGLESTIEFWNTQPVTLLGGYLNGDDAAEIRVVECEGVKIAFLAYTLSTNGIVKSASSEVVIPYIDDALILSDMDRAREMCDILIVSMHWGYENTQTPNSEQYRLAQMIADTGADVILGHHSHALQPIEWIEREDGGRTLCIYSLGNLASGMAYPVNQVGGFLSFRIQGNGEGGLEVTSPVFYPTVFFFGMDWYDTHLYFLEDYTDELAAKHGVQISGYYMSPSDAREYVTNVIDGEFLPEWMK